MGRARTRKWGRRLAWAFDHTTGAVDLAGLQRLLRLRKTPARALRAASAIYGVELER
jgi:hypothetical protein